MIQLYGISNPGFSFTHTYLLDIINLKKYVNKNKGKTNLTYADLQAQIDNPSRVRMIVPFLRKIGIINNADFDEKNKPIDFNLFFTSEAKPFLKFLDVYSDDEMNYNNEELMLRVNKVLQEILSLYLNNLLKEKEYKIITKYLIRLKSLDKYEFFFITSYEFNNVDNIMGYTNAIDLIEYYRNNKSIKSSFEFSSNVNCYSYIMQMLCNFNICKKIDDHFEIKNEELVKNLIGE